MRMAVITSYTKEIDVIGKLTDINKKAYCEKWGLSYISHYGRMSDRHPAWDKIMMSMRTLPYYDYLVWMDADCVFNNFDKQFVTPELALFCRDIGYNGENGQWHYVNTGVFVLKNDPKVFDMLGWVWSKGEGGFDKVEKRSYNGWPWEQGPMCEWLMEHPEFETTNDQSMNCHPNIKIAETFIIHYMGWRADPQYEERTLNEIKEINNKL